MEPKEETDMWLITTALFTGVHIYFENSIFGALKSPVSVNSNRMSLYEAKKNNMCVYGHMLKKLESVGRK